jgi:flagellar motor switch protein FliG
LVLLAISGASKPLVNRVERLIPPKDIKRLRSRLANLGPIQLRDIDNAQRTILETAENLFLKGKIKALKLATFTAAA